MLYDIVKKCKILYKHILLYIILNYIILVCIILFYIILFYITLIYIILFYIIYIYLYHLQHIIGIPIRNPNRFHVSRDLFSGRSSRESPSATDKGTVIQHGRQAI